MKVVLTIEQNGVSISGQAAVAGDAPHAFEGRIELLILLDALLVRPVRDAP